MMLRDGITNLSPGRCGILLCMLPYGDNFAIFSGVCSFRASSSFGCCWWCGCCSFDAIARAASMLSLLPFCCCCCCRRCVATLRRPTSPCSSLVRMFYNCECLTAFYFHVQVCVDRGNDGAAKPRHASHCWQSGHHGVSRNPIFML